MNLRYRVSLVFGLTCFALFGVFVIAIGLGAVAVSPSQIADVLLLEFGLPVEPGLVDPLRQAVITEIRLPRVALGALVGAGLGIAGALMQGIFRNPLADPGLIGVNDPDDIRLRQGVMQE